MILQWMFLLSPFIAALIIAVVCFFQHRSTNRQEKHWLLREHLKSEMKWR